MRAKIICIIFFVSFTNSLKVYSQNLSVIDSLRTSLNLPSLLKTDQFETLNSIGFEYRYSYPDSTIYYCTQAYELGKSIELTKNLSKPLSFIGLAYANKGDYHKSAEYHDQAIQVAIAQQDSTQLGFGYNNLGRMFFDGGDLVRAFDNFILSRDIFEVLQEKSGLAYVYRSLANIYKSQNDFEKAIEMSTHAYELRKQLDDKRGIVSSLLELGLIYEAKGETKEALLKLRLADSVARNINDRVTSAELEQGSAEILFNEKNYEEAYAGATRVLKTVSEITNQKLFIRASLIRGKYFLEQKKYLLALPVFEDIIAKAEQSGNLIYQIDAVRNAATCYRALGNITKSRDLMNQFEILQEQIKNTDLQRQIERLQFLLQIEKKEKENELLKAAQIESESLISAQRFQNRLLLLLMISVTGIMVIFWSFSRKRKIVNQKLQDQNERILKQQLEISKVNDNLKKQNLQLNELNNEKNSLMNIVAHDLKSPLNRISGLASIMEMEGGLPAKQQEYLHMIKNATNSGSNLIIDLLDVNAIEENTSTPIISRIDMGSLVEERVNSFKVPADIKSIRLEVNFSFQDAFLSDADYINRIIDNLVSNAIKFSPKNSVVKVSGKIAGEVATISVSDNGPGFSEGDKTLLFQKFRKLSARPTGGESSNGLGLAIVKKLVDRLGGKIELLSERGKGAEFIVKIPSSKILETA
ncbi:MAG: ATP-binding protein [Cyclobacteriaceae bacterium]